MQSAPDLVARIAQRGRELLRHRDGVHAPPLVEADEGRGVPAVAETCTMAGCNSSYTDVKYETSTTLLTHSR